MRRRKIETLAAGLLTCRNAAIRCVLDLGRAAIYSDGIDIKATVFGLPDLPRVLHRADIFSGVGEGACL